jgi:mRNA interferase RelE/StbE
VTYSIDWEPPAVTAASRYLADDPEGLGALIIGIDALTTDPRPEQSFPFGSPDLRRLRVGRYRVLYEITDATHEILITHIGRTD